MSDKLEIELLPASYGDCILIQYGSARNPHRILIDGGLSGNWRHLRDRLSEFGDGCPLDLLVVTHIDADHIGGIVKLLEQAPGAIVPRDVWFNGYEQIQQYDSRLGIPQGEKLSDRIAALGWPHNTAFRGQAIVVPERGALPRKRLPGNATITLLSPGPQQLTRLATKWGDVLRAEGLLRGRSRGRLGPVEVRGPATDDRLGGSIHRLAASTFTEDDTIANGSSIAFLFEWSDRRVLLGADAYPSVLRRGLERYGATPIDIDICKLPHHGSASNLDVELLRAMRCPAYLVSTNGVQYHHPSPAAIARILVHAWASEKQLFFNYRSDTTRRWSSADLQRKHKYEAIYPDTGTDGITIEL